MVYSELHDKMNQITSNLITKDEFQTWLKANLPVKSCLSLIQQYAVIEAVKSQYDDFIKQSAATDNKDDYGTTYYSMMYDVYSTLIILGFYTGAYVKSKNLNMKEYDLVMSTGLYDYVMDNGGRSIEETFKKCERVTGIDNYFLIRDFVNQFVQGYSPEKAKAVRQELNKLDLRKLQLMKDVSKYNSPVAAAVSEYLYRNDKTLEPIITEEKPQTESKPPIVIAPTADTPIE